MILLRLNDQIIKSLSGPELAILKYAYENTETLLDMNIREFAAHTACSPATVLRFCKKLGYSGYAEFKYALRAEQRERGTKDTNAGNEHAFTAGVYIDTMRSNLEATAKLIREEHLNQVFQYLDSSCPIFLWSPGGLTSVAVEYFEKLLLSIGRQEVYLIESVKMFQHILSGCPRESLLVLISASGKYPPTIRLGKIAQANGIPILSVTPYTSNEAAELADTNFRFFTDQRENLGAEFTSRLPIFFVIQMIIKCYLRYKAEDAAGGSSLSDGRNSSLAAGESSSLSDAWQMTDRAVSAPAPDKKEHETLPLLAKARQLKLTETEKNILAWFEQHETAALHMNLSGLCAVLYTSNATIVRFCQKLGLSGYHDFKYQLRSELRERRETAFYPDEYILHTTAQLQDTIQSLDLSEIEKIASLLTSGRPLYIYGTNLSALAARYLQIVLHSLDYPSILLEWEPLLNGLAGNIRSDAVLLVITASGCAERYLKTFQTAKERNLTLILLTSDRSSPLISYSTITVFTNDWKEEYQHIDINPRVGFFLVIQILIEFIAPSSTG